MFVSNPNAIWWTDGSVECMNVRMYVSICACVHACQQIHVFMNCLPNTSCKAVTKTFAIWGCDIYILEMKNSLPPC